MNFKALVRDIPDFPKPGIIFRDITTLLKHPAGLSAVVDTLAAECERANLIPDQIVGIEARGFVLGAPLAYRLQAGFIPARKNGKLPSQVHRIEYQTEYSRDSLEIHQDAAVPGERLLIVDDLIATGGTAKATAELLQKIGCEVLGFAFLIELTELGGREQLPALPVISLIQY